jgi:hypothetical protein
MIFPDQRNVQLNPAVSPLFGIVKQGMKGRGMVQFEIPLLSQS